MSENQRVSNETLIKICEEYRFNSDPIGQIIGWLAAEREFCQQIIKQNEHFKSVIMDVANTVLVFDPDPGYHKLRDFIFDEAGPIVDEILCQK